MLHFTLLHSKLHLLGWSTVLEYSLTLLTRITLGFDPLLQSWVLVQKWRVGIGPSCSIYGWAKVVKSGHITRYSRNLFYISNPIPPPHRYHHHQYHNHHHHHHYPLLFIECILCAKVHLVADEDDDEELLLVCHLSPSKPFWMGLTSCLCAKCELSPAMLTPALMQCKCKCTYANALLHLSNANANAVQSLNFSELHKFNANAVQCEKKGRGSLHV